MGFNQDIGLVYDNGDYIRVTVVLEDESFPEYVTYLGNKFRLHSCSEDLRALYSEVKEPLLRDHDAAFSEDDGEMELQLENLMGMIEDQQTLIAQLRNKIEKLDKIILALRARFHAEEG